MAITQHASMKNPEQRSVPGLLSASIMGVLLAIAVPAFAETDAERIRVMERKLEALQNEVTQMTSGMAHQPANSEGLPLHGFMDAGFATNSQGDALANPKGFYVGSLSLYLSPHFGDNVKGLVEPILEVAPDGAITPEMERLQIGYTFSDAATVWGGRFHTPYGYWNTAFHHGAQIQTAVLRPRFLDFEDKGGILPAHTVGVWSTGKYKTDTGRLAYDAFVGNGPKITRIANLGNAAQTLGTLDPNTAGDNDHSALAGLNVGYEFSGGMSGLRLAAHMMRGDVEDDAPIQPNKTGLNMAGGSVVYQTDDWEVMSEYYRFDNKDRSGTSIVPGSTYTSWAGYLQAGKSFDDLTPFVRLERTALNQQDNYFSMQASGQSYARQALGLRYSLNPNTALKLEMLNTNFKADAGRPALGYRSLFVQYAIGF